MPLYALPAELPLLVTEQSDRRPARVKIRKRLGELCADDQQLLPFWVVDCVVRDKEMSKELSKLYFNLEHHPSTPDSDPLAKLNLGRLSAPRLLRVAKIVAHAESKLAEAEGGAVSSTPVEVVCNQDVLSALLPEGCL